MTIKTTIKSVDDFFFKPQPVYNVALMRIGMGFLLIFNWLMIVWDLEALYGPQGILSFETSRLYGNHLRFSLFDFLAPTYESVIAMAILNLVAVLAMTVGYRTRLSTIIAFLTVVSFHHRNGMILNSADSVLRIFLFLSIFTPSGEAFSIDRWLKLKKGEVTNEPAMRSPWALRLIQIQFCVIYIATVLFKIKGTQWVDGTAVYVATRLDEFFRYPLPVLNNMFLIKLATWSTLIIEFALGTLVWFKDLRYWVLASGILFHLGIEYVMSIPVFEWAMIVIMVSMVENEDIEKIIIKLKEKRVQWNQRLQPSSVKVAT